MATIDSTINGVLKDEANDNLWMSRMTQKIGDEYFCLIFTSLPPLI